MPTLLDPSVHRECDAVVEHWIAVLDGNDDEWLSALDEDDEPKCEPISLHPGRLG